MVHPGDFSGDQNQGEEDRWSQHVFVGNLQKEGLNQVPQIKGREQGSGVSHRRLRATASDGLSQSNVATVSVQVVNRPPVALNDTASTTKSTAVTISVLANDSDPDHDPLSVTGLTQPASGTIVLNSNGTITYTPKKGFSGTDTFTYKASDGLAQSSAATVTITIK